MSSMLITHEDFNRMRVAMDKDGDGMVDKVCVCQSCPDEHCVERRRWSHLAQEEFKIAYKIVYDGDENDFEAAYDIVWKKIDKDGDGNLTVDELSAFYGFDKDGGTGEMSDDQILQALAVRRYPFTRRRHCRPNTAACRRTLPGSARSPWHNKSDCMKIRAPQSMHMPTAIETRHTRARTCSPTPPVAAKHTTSTGTTTVTTTASHCTAGCGQLGAELDAQKTSKDEPTKEEIQRVEKKGREARDTTIKIFNLEQKAMTSTDKVRHTRALRAPSTPKRHPLASRPFPRHAHSYSHATLTPAPHCPAPHRTLLHARSRATPIPVPLPLPRHTDSHATPMHDHPTIAPAVRCMHADTLQGASVHLAPPRPIRLARLCLCLVHGAWTLLSYPCHRSM